MGFADEVELVEMRDLGSDSIDTVKVTHSNYFDDIRSNYFDNALEALDNLLARQARPSDQTAAGG